MTTRVHRRSLPLRAVTRRRHHSIPRASFLLGVRRPASGYLTGGCRGQGSAVIESLFGLGDAGLNPVGDELAVGTEGSVWLGTFQAPHGSCSACELGGDPDGDLLEDWSVCVASYAVIASIAAIAGNAGGISGLAGGQRRGVRAGCFRDGNCSPAGLRLHLATSELWLVRTWRATASMAAT